ncbi:hypothetical protein HPB52_013409 [Rhipicephalus sanguineus]|uniref:Uncharacterized protein n=1 Tax=Rhipicephalus sanguineus TaxID=34632 RepID=A0A9D4YPS1_RHISA|nr:hypothetical protein HPB52_013409 [Rhipicephalus sanguineus]
MNKQGDEKASCRKSSRKDADEDPLQGGRRYVFSSIWLMVSVTTVGAMCTAFKPHLDDEIAPVWGTSLRLGNDC